MCVGKCLVYMQFVTVKNTFTHTFQYGLNFYNNIFLYYLHKKWEGDGLVKTLGS